MIYAADVGSIGFTSDLALKLILKGVTAGEGGVGRE